MARITPSRAIGYLTSDIKQAACRPPQYKDNCGEVTAADHRDGHQLAGSRLRPRRTKVGRHSGFSASSSRKFGRRRSKVEIAISALDARQLGTEAKVDAAADEGVQTSNRTW
jgi:hypothetical protein